MEISMYDRMQSLPLLQGITLEDFESFLLNMKLDFKRHDEDDTIVFQGAKCDSLIYIIDGEYEVEYRDTENNFILCEHFKDTPLLIEPYNMFSIKRTYERSYSFMSQGATFTISKEYFNQRLLCHNIVRSNLINYLSNNLRKSKEQRWFRPTDSVEKKMVAVIESFCTNPIGEKILKIKMNDLSTMIDETRLNVSKVLNKWNDAHLIELKRFGFKIYDFETLKQKVY